MATLPEALDRLVSRGVLTAEQAAAVREEVGTSSRAARPRAPGRISVGAEIAAYLGGVLTLVALGFLVSETWEDAPRAVRVLLLAVLTAVLVGAGAALRDDDATDDDPARGRLAGTLWAAAVLSLGWGAALAVDQSDDDWAVLLTGLLASALAAPLYAVRRRGAQLVALVAAVLFAVIGAATLVSDDTVFVALVVAAYGAVVVAVALIGWLEPSGTGIAAGSVVALVSVQVASFDDARTAVLLLGVAMCVALFFLAARTGALVAGLATVALAAFLPQLLHDVAGDGAAFPVLLLVTGLVLLGGAAVTVRLKRQAA